MIFCRNCGTEINTSLHNIAPSRLRIHSYICNKCYYTLYRERHLIEKKRYYQKHKEERSAYNKRNREKILEKQRIRQWGYKSKAIKYYSGGTMACANPFGEHKEPYTTLEALSIDHINGGGTQERLRKAYGRSGSFYLWLKKHGYPSGYQILCMNCQFIKRIRNDELRKKTPRAPLKSLTQCL